MQAAFSVEIVVRGPRTETHLPPARKCGQGRGAGRGIIFGFATRKFDISGWPRYALGALHGIAMMCLFYLVAFRAVTSLAGMEDADVMSLARIVGWPLLVFTHALHGVVVAWVVKSRMAAPVPVFGPAITVDGRLRDSAPGS